MPRLVRLLLAAQLALPTLLLAQSTDDVVRSATSAGPASISAEASVMDWEMNQVRAGSNGWTCLPDRPDTPGEDPWCLDAPWLDFLHAYMTRTDPTYERVGFAYMLMGDTPVSNADPYASQPTGPEDWVTGVGAHLMMIVPGPSALKGISTDHRNGGPWVMWPDTPYAHLMIPVASR